MVRPLAKPIKTDGGLAILRGSIAPEGCVVKLAGHERVLHSGPARVFDSEEAAFAAVQSRKIQPGDVVVIRYEGPKGGPGMREMLAVTGALVGQGIGESDCIDHRWPLQRRDARTDGRPRGAGSGEWRTDRAGARRRHDYLDVKARRLDVAANLEERRAQWKPPAPNYRAGVMAKYAKLVTSASLGAVTSAA